MKKVSDYGAILLQTNLGNVVKIEVDRPLLDGLAYFRDFLSL